MCRANTQLLAANLCVATFLSMADAFSTSRPIEPFRTQSKTATFPKQRSRTTTILHLSNIIDAQIIPDDELEGNSLDTDNLASQNLIEYSQNQDPEWKNMPIAFCDTESNTYVDCTLAFYVKDPSGDEDEGAEYALGIPCEVPIVIALEFEDERDAAPSVEEGEETPVVNLSKVVPINPDDNADESFMTQEEKEEIFQIAARALMDEFGESIRLKKTPRVLTLAGDLDEVIGDWKEVLLGSLGSESENEKVSFEAALEAFNEDEDDDDFFDRIMKRDLGPDYMKLVEDDDDDEMDEALLKMFDPDGLDGDLNEMMEDINNIKTEESKIKGSSYDQLVQQLQPSAALKLLNFLGPGGKEYTILRPLRPILLVGKEDPDDYTRRMLLTEEEKLTILPRLESACREGLEKAGYFLGGTEDEKK